VKRKTIKTAKVESLPKVLEPFLDAIANMLVAAYLRDTKDAASKRKRPRRRRRKV
jgi:hypothetical protein